MSARKPATSSPLRPISPPANNARATPPGRSHARDLLRKHYALGVGPPAPSAAKVNDPMNFDSPAFDARSYYEQLITTSSLPSLLKRENELLTEIRQLDSERQSLVYNHHHELIAASDTITAIKSRAESLEPVLDSLKAAFSEISLYNYTNATSCPLYYYYSGCQFAPPRWISLLVSMLDLQVKGTLILSTNPKTMFATTMSRVSRVIFPPNRDFNLSVTHVQHFIISTSNSRCFSCNDLANSHPNFGKVY
ncbi:hypothetical protein APHAL10511_007436 [Amanita phalloides]|nr:hypothetical protein APHAL10511_007436 [Amanita phalloides]